MPKEKSSRPLIWGLGSALAASLMLCAFLLGRESGREGRRTEQVSAAPEEALARKDPATQAEQKPRTAALDPRRFEAQGPAGAQGPMPVEGDIEGIERGPDGRILLSNTGSRRPKKWPASAMPSSEASQTGILPQSTRTDSASAGSSTAEAASYFQRMKAIKSAEPTAEPEVFAMALMQAGMQGNTQRFDALLEDAARMRAEAEQVKPPPSCEAHHRATLEMLTESQLMLEELREAITTKDMEDVGLMSHRAQSLEAKARALQEMEAQILSRQ